MSTRPRNTEGDLREALKEGVRGGSDRSVEEEEEDERRCEVKGNADMIRESLRWNEVGMEENDEQE